MSDYKPEYEYDPSGDTGAGVAAPGAPNTSAMPSEPQYIEETGRWTFTDAEGVSFEYDDSLKAWFPMVKETKLQSSLRPHGLILFSFGV